MFRSDLDGPPFQHSLVPVTYTNNALSSDKAIGSTDCDRRVDDALENALKSVPLPDGLLTRLDRLARVTTGVGSSQVDWYGMA